MKNKMRLIIPSAKLVPEELQKLGKLPAIIYPINQRIMFDYIYEQYTKYCSAVDIICYEKADKVKRRLEKYTDDKVRIKILPDLQDLGYTVWYALKDVEEPVIINFADTIVMDAISEIVGDAFFYQEIYMSETWTYFDEVNGVITNVYDKKILDNGLKKKMFVGVFKIMDTHRFKDCLKKALSKNNHKMNSFYYALQLYSQQCPLQSILTENWFDIGHEDRYYSSKLAVKAREFNHITIDKERGILRKSSDDKDKFIGEIKWYLKLPSDVEYVRPRIFDFSTSYESPYISMEYYSYYTLHELFLYGDLTMQQWIDVFNRIRFVCNDFKRYTVKDQNIRASLENMYLTKTLQRIDKMRQNNHFLSFFENSIKVNENTYKPLNKVAEILSKVVPEMLYDVDTFNIIHGDLCFANIMIDSNFSFVKVIDPRGKFGTYDIYGDPRYEMAKLFHSVDGKYDFIIKDLFEKKYNLENASLTYKIQDRKRVFDLYQIFINTFCDEIGNDLKKIELIEALLFLSMIPLHGESLDHQIVMLGTGLDILNRVVDIRECSDADEK